MPPEKLLLAFDTSAAHCAAALLLGGRVLTDVTEVMAKGQAERLMPLLEEVLAAQGHSWHDLAALAVGVGPGNFTGIRIAVSAARGLALGLGIPAIGVTAFDAVAHGAARPVAVVEDARRGMVYVQVFGTGQEVAQLLSLEEAQNVVADLAVIGSGARLLGRAEVSGVPPATAVGLVAAARLGQDWPRPAPFYVRAADATPPSDPPPVILDA